MKRGEQTMNTLREQYCLCLTKNSLMCSWTCSVKMTPLSACVHAGHVSAYITLELRQTEHWNLKEVPSYWHLLVFSNNRGSMKFLTIQFMFHEVSANTHSQTQHKEYYCQQGRKGHLLCGCYVWTPSATHTWINTIMWEDCGLITIGRCLRCWQVWWS